MTLRDIVTNHAPLASSLGGLLIGFVFGAVVYRTNFCVMGSLSDAMTFGDRRRLRAWMLAIAVAIVGAQALAGAGVVPLDRSMYLSSPSLNWVGHVAGGLLFGFGMVFAGGCASRNLARVGGGDLRALMTLVVLGIFAYVAIGGILGPLRAAIEGFASLEFSASGPTAPALPHVLIALGVPAGAAPLTAAGLAVALLLAYCFRDPAFRTSPLHIVSGIAVGLCVTAGWALTGLAFDELAARPVAPISLTFVRPTGDALEWLERYTALGLPGFGVSTVFGTILGGFAAARLMGRFRLTTFSDKADTLRSLGGAALMGVGGVMALGCTIGQGVTGLSTLAVGSILAVAGIVAGGILGIRALERMLGA